MKQITIQRNNEFVKRCQKTLARELERGVFPSVRRIAALTVYGRADRFYISYLCALRNIYEYNNRKAEENPEEENVLQKQTRYLNQRARDIKEKTGITLADALGLVLNTESAPRFYISVDSAIRIVRKHWNEILDGAYRERRML